MQVFIPFVGHTQLTRAWAWREARKLTKFVIVGGSSFALFITIYTILSHLFPHTSRTLLTFASSVLSGVYNFTVHRYWTFRSRALMGGALRRYLIVVMVATAEQTALFYVGHELLHLFDYLVQVLVAAPVAITTYMLHRFFTFHPKHGIR